MNYRTSTLTLTLLSAVALSACASPQTQGVATQRPPEPAAREIAITVTRAGFEPALVTAHVGEVVRLTFTRTVEHTCITSVVLWLSSDETLERTLPMSTPVSLTLELQRAGDIGFACPMHMYGGRIDVRASPQSESVTRAVTP